MAQIHHFKRVVKEICRNCHGTGQVAVQDGHRLVRIKCPICAGYGMVQKTNEGDITIEPYNPGEYRKKSWQELNELESDSVDSQVCYP